MRARTNAEVMNTLEERIQERHLLKHPFYQAWNAGQLSLQTLQAYSKQYYRQVEAFPTYVSAVHANCPLLPVRQQLLENLLEEERGSENHPELWLRFAEALGVQRDDLLATSPLPETTTLLQTFRALTRDRSYQAGLAALFAYEAQVPQVAAAKIDGLKQFYGVHEARGLAFFQVHLQADRFHAETARQILHTHLSPETAGEAVSACDQALEALWGMLDGIYSHSC